LKERCRLEPRTNFFFFRLRNRQKLVRIRFENIWYMAHIIDTGHSTFSGSHSAYPHPTQSTKINLTFREPCIVIYSYNKSQQGALFLKFIFDKVLFMFRTDLLSTQSAQTSCVDEYSYGKVILTF
jgi:hypothetical protein